MKNRYLIILCAIALLLACPLIFSANKATDYDRLFEKNKGMPLRTLKEKGNTLLANNKVDEAMACYVLVANSYTDHLPDSDKLVCAMAWNNMGYVNFYCYNDYVQAYDCYLKALDLSETLPKPNIQSTILLNIANIYDDYTDYKTSMSLYRKAFHAGISEKSWDMVVISYIHMVSYAITQSTDIRDINQQFASLRIPKVYLLTYARYLQRGYHAYRQHNYSLALQCFDQAQQHIDTPYTPERYLSEAMMMSLQVYDTTGESEKAITACKKVMPHLKDMHADDVLSAIYGCMNHFYEKMGQKELARESLFRYYQISDTLFNSRKAGSIQNLRARHDLMAKEAELHDLKMQKQAQVTVLTVGLVAALIVIILLYSIYRKSRRQHELTEQLYRQALTNAEASHPKKSATDINSEAMQHIVDLVYQALAERPEIYDTNFSSENLSDMIGVRNREMTQAIRELTGKNFNALLGEQRVKEACRRMADREHYGHLTIEAIAQGVGFKSRTNFVMVFKRFTGLTPSEFLKHSREAHQTE